MMDAIASFWWGDDDNSNKMHWYAWWKLCYPKKEGGMGFRDFHSFNLAMLSKQIWRLVTDLESLCAKVLGAKYYPNGNLLSAGPKSGSSFTWQSIVASIPTFKRGYIGELALGTILTFIRIPGSHQVQTVRSLHHKALVFIQKCVILFLQLLDTGM
jgi:hypothetical protein